jgi:hypothetical protein
MRIAAVGQPPVVRLKHPTTGATQVVKGAFYVRVKREAGWTIVDDPMNVLLPEWVERHHQGCACGIGGGAREAQARTAAQGEDLTSSGDRVYLHRLN